MRVSLLAAAACAALSLGVGGCSSTPTTFYTLSEMAPAKPLPVSSGALLGVGRVTIPETLDRPQVVRRASESRLDVDDFSRWGGPLADGTARVLTGDLRLRLGPDRVVLMSAEPITRPAYVLEVQIDEFDAGTPGPVELRARWTIARGPDEKTVVVTRASRISEDAPAGLDGAVAGMSRALGRLADEISASVATLPAGIPPAGRAVPIAR